VALPFYTDGMNVPFNFFDTTPRDCWLEIDATQLSENVRRLEAHIQRPIFVAVKANAYGHGYGIAARAFIKGGARYLGVANYAEGRLLRELGIEVPILILGGLLPDEMKLAAAAGLEFFVFRPDHIEALRQMPKTKPIRVHIKVDTGMGRLGCFAEDVAELGAQLKAISGIIIAGMGTHFATASRPNNDHTNSQIDKFDQAIASLAAIGIRPEILHAANSSGALYHPRARYDMVRVGIVAYGVPPSSIVGPDIPVGVKTALTWHARITSSKILKANTTVGYGCEYVMSKDARVGILPVGYADGFQRIPKNVNSVLIDGQEHKTLGRISMDQCAVDLDGCADIMGAEAILLGRQGGKEITVQDLAKRWSETNTYGVYVGISPRVPRRIVGAL
jgi:alanine racemase